MFPVKQMLPSSYIFGRLNSTMFENSFFTFLCRFRYQQHMAAFVLFGKPLLPFSVTIVKVMCSIYPSTLHWIQAAPTYIPLCYSVYIWSAIPLLCGLFLDINPFVKFTL